MPRYFARSRASVPLFFEPMWDGESHKPALDVPDHEAADTGLIDKNGNAILRAPNPMGFHADL